MIKAISYWHFFIAYIPFIVSALIFLSTTHVFKKGDANRLFNSLRIVLLGAVLISSLPAIWELTSGIKLVFFYDRIGWRYTFLCQNPNQYGVSTVLFMYIITYITLTSCPERLGKLLLVQIIVFVPVLYSGSRSSTIVYFLNFLITGLIYVYKSKKGLLFMVIAVVIATLNVNFILVYLKSKGGNISRALSIFDVATGKNELDLQTIGHSISSAQDLFVENPMLGIGLGNKMARVGGIEIHNTFWVFLAETGIVGFAAFSMLFFGPVAYALLYLRNNMFKLYLISTFVLFSAQNYTGMLLRQRWVWFFLSVTFCIIILIRKRRIGRYEFVGI